MSFLGEEMTNPAERALYLQIVDSLMAKIEAGELAPGDKVPSERDLSKQLQVSRMTVRHAMNALYLRGVLHRELGRGTFIAEPKLEEPTNILFSFTENMVHKGITPGARLLCLQRIPATRSISQELHLDLGQDVYYVKRLRLANQEPMVIEHSYFPAALFPGLDKHDLETQSIYRILESEYDVGLAQASQSYEPTVANEEESELLKIPPGAPLMLVRRTAFDKQGRPVEQAKDLYRGDRNRFVSKMIFRG
jgi:GntR family transcriptional regulator